LDLDNPVARAQQVEDERQRIIPAAWFEQDQKVGRGGRVLVQVTLELGEARGIAAETDGLHPTPAVRVALRIEDRQRTRGGDVLAIPHVDADVDPLPLDCCVLKIADRDDCRCSQSLSPPFCPELKWSRATRKARPLRATTCKGSPGAPVFSPVLKGMLARVAASVRLDRCNWRGAPPSAHYVQESRGAPMFSVALW